MTTREAPISRDLVDAARPWLRLLLGVAFVGYSANATIFIAADDLMWLFPQTKNATLATFPDALWYSAILAVVLFAGEVATSERHPGTYRIFLAPDVFYTARGMFSGMSGALAVLLAPWIGEDAAKIVGVVLALPIVGFIGYIIAKWGEILLFDKRRTSRRSKKEE